MEALVGDLIEARAAMVLSTDVDARRDAAGVVGEIARQALLLDRVHDALADTDGTLSQLTVADAMGHILGSLDRASGGGETATLSHLGNGPELLGVEPMQFESPVADESTFVKIPPEWAFPEAVDAADQNFMQAVDSRLAAQLAELETQRAQVVPAQPQFTVAEFAGVHRRWHGMFSNAQERRDPMAALAYELLGDTYDVAGRDSGDALISLEQGLARGLLMRWAVDMFAGPRFIDMPLGNPLSAVRVGRSQPAVAGSATSPALSFAELYPSRLPGDRGGQVAPAGRRSLAGERDSRQHLAALAYPATADRMNAYQQSSPPTAGGLPLEGVHPATPEEGWSYLFPIHDAQSLSSGRPELVAYEQKAMPPEVVDYLMAAEQAEATLRPHVPTAGRRRIGGPQIREGGIEAGRGRVAAEYLEGEQPGGMSTTAAALAGTRTLAADALHVDLDRSGRGGPDQAAILHGELRSYLEEYFDVRTSQGERVAAVLAIAETEHRLAGRFDRFTDIAELSTMIAEEMAMAGGLRMLSMMGVYGRIASMAIGSWMRSQGVSDLTAVISVAQFVSGAADAATLTDARGWALVARSVVGDVESLLENAITGPFSAIAENLGKGPTSALELGEAVQPALQDPAVRAEVLAQIDAEIAADTAARVEAAAAQQMSVDADPHLLALRDAIAGYQSAGAVDVSDAPLPGVDVSTSVGAATVSGRPSPANMAGIEPLLGTPVDALDAPPPDYRFYTRDGQRRLRRITADDAAYAPLTVDANGDIRLAGHARAEGMRMTALSALHRPASMTDARLRSVLDAVSGHPLLRRRLGSFGGPVDGAIRVGDFGNLKGNIAEVLAAPIVQGHLVRIQTQRGRAELHDAARARIPKGDGTYHDVEFSDGVIAEVAGGHLYIRAVVEVKGRPRGGADAQHQIWEWMEGRGSDGRDHDGAETGAGALEIVVDGTAYVYDPGSGRPNQVINFMRAQRVVVAPEGAQDLGSDLPEGVAAPVHREALSITDAELRYITRLVAERWTSD